MRFDQHSPTSILLVDDEAGLRKVLDIALTDLGYGVLQAPNGREALRIFECSLPPIVLSDVKMPGMDGIEVLRRIKQGHPRVEVVILTGHGSDREKAQAEELGAFAYLQKPVDIDLLARVMREAVRGVPGSRSCACGDALRDAIITPRAEIGPEVRKRLAPILERYLK